jgi:steroid 5-alpha reductase family enzyme
MSFFVCLKNVTLIIGGMNLLGYFITAITKTHKITDLTGCSSFVVATILLSLQSSRIFKQFPKKDEFSIFENRLFFVNLAVILWGTRLGSFLFTRILSMKEDKRLSKFFPKENEGFFDRTKSNFPFYLGFFWTLQALWGIICLLPVSIINTIPLQWVMNRKFPTQTALNVSYSLFGLNLPKFVEYIPICGIFIGIFIETLADYQKSVYRSKPTNKHHWCDVGLWSLSRYPNCKSC